MMALRATPRTAVTYNVEQFVVRPTDEVRAQEVRRTARKAFLALDDVRDWRTQRSIAEDRPTLFIETIIFDDEKTAKAASARFSQMYETRAYLALVDEFIVGQHFIDITEDMT